MSAWHELHCSESKICQICSGHMFPENPHAINIDLYFPTHFLKLMKAQKLESLPGMLASQEKLTFTAWKALFLNSTSFLCKSSSGSAGAAFMSGKEEWVHLEALQVPVVNRKIIKTLNEPLHVHGHSGTWTCLPADENFIIISMCSADKISNSQLFWVFFNPQHLKAWRKL